MLDLKKKKFYDYWIDVKWIFLEKDKIKIIFMVIKMIKLKKGMIYVNNL